MANKTYKDTTFHLDNAAGTLTALHQDMNQKAIQGVQDVIEDSAFGDSERTYLPGLAGATLPINGFLNTTTDGIFGPLVGNQTSITKTFSYYNGVSYYTGEAYLTDVQNSGSVNDLEVWSATLTVTGAVTRTSVNPVS